MGQPSRQPEIGLLPGHMAPCLAPEGSIDFMRQTCVGWRAASARPVSAGPGIHGHTPPPPSCPLPQGWIRVSTPNQQLSCNTSAGLYLIPRMRPDVRPYGTALLTCGKWTLNCVSPANKKHGTLASPQEEAWLASATPHTHGTDHAYACSPRLGCPPPPLLIHHFLPQNGTFSFVFLEKLLALSPKLYVLNDFLH